MVGFNTIVHRGPYIQGGRGGFGGLVRLFKPVLNWLLPLYHQAAPLIKNKVLKLGTEAIKSTAVRSAVGKAQESLLKEGTSAATRLLTRVTGVASNSGNKKIIANTKKAGKAAIKIAALTDDPPLLSSLSQKRKYNVNPTTKRKPPAKKKKKKAAQSLI